MGSTVVARLRITVLIFVFSLLLIPIGLSAQGYVYEDEGQPARADSVVNIILQIQKVDLDSAIRYTRNYLSSGDLDSVHQLWLRQMIHRIHLRRGELDSALLLYEEDRRLINSLKQVPEVKPIRILNVSFALYSGLARVYYYQFQLDSVEFYAFKAKEVAKKAEDENMLSIANNLLSVIYHQNGELEKALELALETAEGARNRKDTSDLVTNLNNIGSFYHMLNNTPKAIDTFIELLEVAESNGDEGGILNAYSGLSRAYYKQEEYHESMKFLKRALAVEAKGAELEKGFIYSELGDVYKKLEQTDSSMIFYEKSLALFEKAGALDDQAYILERISSLFLALEKPEEALEYVQRGLDILEGLESPGDELLLQVSKARAYLDLDRARESLKPTQRVLELVEEVRDVTYKSNAYELAHQVYQQLGDYPKAYRYLQQFQVAQDSIESEEQIRALSRAEYQFDLAQEKENFAADQREQQLRFEQEIAQQRIVAWAIGIIAFILTVAVFLVVRSGRQRAKANEELAEANGKLHQLDQFKTRLFANINHDIRTPLTLIRGYAINIQGNEDNYLTEASEQDLDHLQQNTMLLSEMTNEIQDLLLLEENKLKLSFNRIEITGYVDRLVKMFSSLADLSDIKLNFEDHIEREFMVHLDQGHFDKIFYNLISNAFRYTAAGGQIRVILQEESDHMLLQIADSGKGIAPEDLPHIFDRFYQSPLNEYRSKEGFGIGLAVVRELVNLHEGEIAAQSILSAGTTFTVKLPLNLDKTADEPLSFNEEMSKNHPVRSANSTMISTEEKDKKTILVVDDHMEIRKYISGILTRYYQVKEASDGKQALEVLERNHIDLIMTDLMMPWLDGYDLIEQLNASDKFASIPVMVVSARTTEEDKHRVLDAGVNEFIAKPFDPAELEKRIQNVLQGQTQNGNPWTEIVSDQETLSTVEQNMLKKLNQIILDHVSDPNLSTDLIAQELSASRSKAIRMIKSLTGKTPLAYIKEIRMNYVDDLIKKQKVKNASEAAQSVGMKHATHFSKQYKSHFGELPVFGK